jgi:medium-chain acyl-[acyl-carrier-protein] hydrolase
MSRNDYGTASGVKRWRRHPTANPETRLRLFCFPYAGGGGAVFRTWQAALPPAIEVCAVQLPGREDRVREAPYTHLAPLVQALTAALYPYLGDGVPFAFYGHSMGSLIGFELARCLRREDAPGPVLLFVAAHRAPQLPDRNPPVHRLPDRALLERLRDLGGTRGEVLDDAELRALFFPLLRADFAVCETYRYIADDPLPCPIVAMGGVNDPEVRLADLAAWRAQTSDQFMLRLLPGGHFFPVSSCPLLLREITGHLIPYLQPDREAGVYGRP